MKPIEFDERFDAGKDMSAQVDRAKVRRLTVEAKRINVDFPAWGVAELDRQAPKVRNKPASSDQNVDCCPPGGTERAFGTPDPRRVSRTRGM